MRGKTVNLCIGFMNILLGALILLFTLYIPKEITIQENYVVTYIKYAIYVVLIVVSIIDFYQSINHRNDTTFNLGYILGIFVLSFIYIKQPIISVFSIISGLVVLIKSLTENLVELDSTLGISISIVIMATIFIICIVTFNYALLGENIKNRENKNETAYKNDFFKYIQELDISDAYINVKKDEKYGFINQNGDTVIDFLYDYASPFVKIKIYDKEFEVALVSKEGSSYIIMKNGRIVMSYRNESSDDNYETKIKELENFYYNTLGQSDKMEYELPEINSIDNINKVPSYKEESDDYTYRYNYNEGYDILVTQSKLGLGDKYELAKKRNLKEKYNLDVTNLDYDENYLYLFSNGTIPFYDVSKRVQGWIVADTLQHEEMTGKAQILDFYEDRMLLRNFNDNTIYFIDFSGNPISNKYKDFFICNDDRYIVQGENGLYYVMDKEYNNIFSKEYEVLNPRFSNIGLYLTLDSTENIEFTKYGYAKLKWNLLNHDGEVICDNIEQIYDLLYKLPDDSNSEKENYSKFVKNIKKLNYKFVGDKFYKTYMKND